MPSNEFSPSCGLCALSMQYAQIKGTLPSKIVLCLGVTSSFDIFTGNYYIHKGDRWKKIRAAFYCFMQCVVDIFCPYD